MRLRDRLPNYLTEADITDYETESSYIIYKEDLYTVGVDSHTGVIISRDTNSKIVFNAVIAAATSGGLIFVKRGTYTLDATGSAHCVIPANTVWAGEGDVTNIVLDACDFYILNVDNVTIRDIKFTGNFGVYIRATTADHSGYNIINCHFKDTGVSNSAALVVNANAFTLSRLKILNCFFDTCGYHGVQFTGGGVPKLIKDVVISGCYTYKCGWSGVWSTGMDLAESNDLSDTIVSDCIFEQSWESGLHFESSRTMTNVLIVNCISLDNGQKAGGATYGAGYLTTNGVLLKNCVASGNLGAAGFYMSNGGDAQNCYSKSNVSGYKLWTSAANNFHLSDCEDNGSAYGFKITDIVADSTVVGRGLISRNSTTYDLQAQLATGLDIELWSYGATSGESKTTFLGSTAYPVTNSRFDIHLFKPVSTGAYTVYSQSCVNIRISGEIVTDMTDAIILTIPTDVVISNMRIDSTGTYGIHTVNAVVGVLVKETVIENVAGAPALTTGIENGGTAGGLVCERSSIRIQDVTNTYVGCVFFENWGTSTGTGAEQAISHLLSGTPTLVLLSDIETAALAYQSAAAAADHIHITAILNKDYAWYARL